ncbi:putative nuclear mRNA splicing, via spliceosome-related protein [Kockovaella imperatae]|uniref:Splicing factor YJU2 n=1 Tax=Kockovaella imperatae TaxID=4999 RepID=A0A1Y1U834_9TREE|nr:putative nuclear mRNA splicing, via spliceosome-related protein [Kockovaella imperatae]ORX34200.1 putative nuclear mRNA splicing, via spliceosome-related protein [Kockovaella imperatae]
MSERKVINKYFPPDFDPSKIKRRKIGKNPQMVVTLMAPFSMRCKRCGEYVYKGKKFNARKETAVGFEYYGIKVFRFYIKCPVCSSEFTFRTDPKTADFIVEEGATRNFENWSEADPTGKRTFVPDAAADDDYDSDGNLIEGRGEKDAMADLEQSQEQSRREMEMMDELADLRQRNARMEQSNANADPEALLAALHAERQSAEEEARLKMEKEEDDALVAQYFAKVAASKPTNGDSTVVDRKGKGKAKAIEEEAVDGDEEDVAQSDGSEGSDVALPALTVKRRPVPGGTNGSAAEPSVFSLLAAKGKTLDSTNGTANGASTGTNGAAPLAPGAVKRKREGMQKLLGIKTKSK